MRKNDPGPSTGVPPSFRQAALWRNPRTKCRGSSARLLEISHPFCSHLLPFRHISARRESIAALLVFGISGLVPPRGKNVDGQPSTTGIPAPRLCAVNIRGVKSRAISPDEPRHFVHGFRQSAAWRKDGGTPVDGPGSFFRTCSAWRKDRGSVTVDPAPDRSVHTATIP